MKERPVRLFLASMTTTLYLLALAAGFGVAEYNTRNIAFGDVQPIIQYQRDAAALQIHAFGQSLRLDMSDASIRFMGLDSILHIIRSIENLK